MIFYSALLNNSSRSRSKEMNIMEYPLGLCPKCDKGGAFVSIFLSDSTDTTRDAVLRVVIGHAKCGFHLFHEHQILYRELQSMGWREAGV